MKTVPIDIDIPEGFEADCIRVPEEGDWFLDNYGCATQLSFNNPYLYVLILKQIQSPQKWANEHLPKLGSSEVWCFNSGGNWMLTDRRPVAKSEPAGFAADLDSTCTGLQSPVFAPFQIPPSPFSPPQTLFLWHPLHKKWLHAAKGAINTP